MAPIGKTMDNADALIFAQAVAKEKLPALRTLQDLINNDQMGTRARDPGAEITEIPSVTDKVGRKIRVFAERSGNRAIIRMKAYSEEKDATRAYWTVFSVSADSQAAAGAGTEAFQAMLRAYR